MELDHMFIFSSLPPRSTIIELHAVAAVFEMLKSQAFNLYSYSQYIAQSLQLLETVPVLDITL